MRAAWTVIIIIILCVIGYFVYVGIAAPSGSTQATTTASTTDEQATVVSVVTGFGRELNMVSTLAATDTAAADMQQYYGPFVSPDLLAQWETNPTTAPGHTTSSPSPDHIDVAGVTQNADGSYTVNGNVIETLQTGSASATPSGSFPITATVSNVNGTWLITGWSGYPPAASATSTSS